MILNPYSQKCYVQDTQFTPVKKMCLVLVTGVRRVVGPIDTKTEKNTVNTHIYDDLIIYVCLTVLFPFLYLYNSPNTCGFSVASVVVVGVHAS